MRAHNPNTEEAEGDDHKFKASQNKKKKVGIVQSGNLRRERKESPLLNPNYIKLAPVHTALL